MQLGQIIYLFIYCKNIAYQLSSQLVFAHVIILSCLWIAIQMYICTPKNINPTLPLSTYTGDVTGLSYQIHLNRHH